MRSSLVPVASERASAPTDQVVDGAWALRTLAGGGIRRLYFTFMSTLIVVIAVVLHFFQPVRLITISATMANFAAMVFPLAFVYLNRRLPRAAQPSRWGAGALYANVVFFGFFFVNFVWNEVTGAALVRF